MSDCRRDLLGHAYRVLAAHGGESTIQAIVDRNMNVSLARGSEMGAALGDYSSDRIRILAGLDPGAAAAVLVHEVKHATDNAPNVCQGEVNARNAGLDLYDALPEAGRQNRRINSESSRRSANPEAFDAKTYQDEWMRTQSSGNRSVRAEGSKC